MTSNLTFNLGNMEVGASSNECVSRIESGSSPQFDPTKCCASLDYYRDLIQTFINQHDYESAVFWADKLVTIGGEEDRDYYLLAQTYYYSGQYTRGANLLISRKLHQANLYFRLLTAKCFYSAKEYGKALDILDTDLPTKTVLRIRTTAATSANMDLNNTFPISQTSNWNPPGPINIVKGQLYLLRGKIHESLMNRSLASENYKEAISCDIYCYEAFRLLTQHNMMSQAEETELYENICFEAECNNGDVDLIKYLYAINIRKYSAVPTSLNPIQFATMRKNLDALTGDAERFYYNCEYLKAYKFCLKIVDEDPYHTGCLPVYIACLVELRKITELFRSSHKLIETMPNSALSWYAVGCYYFSIGKHDLARRNLNKAMSIDPVFGPAWLLFGHSFAEEGENDQAMAAYFKATQLMKGCHLPLLHVGMQCGISNNPVLALKFLEDALFLAPKDPTIRHEMGVIKYNEERYTEALKHFQDALAMIEKPNLKYRPYPRKWESLYNNLGHCCRKLKRYADAYTYHKQALIMKPSNASTYAALGLLYAINNKTDSAVESLHKALSLRRDDAFSNTLLRYCIEKLVEESKDGMIVFPLPKDGGEGVGEGIANVSGTEDDVITEDDDNSIVAVCGEGEGGADGFPLESSGGCNTSSNSSGSTSGDEDDDESGESSSAFNSNRRKFRYCSPEPTFV